MKLAALVAMGMLFVGCGGVSASEEAVRVTCAQGASCSGSAGECAAVCQDATRGQVSAEDLVLVPSNGVHVVCACGSTCDGTADACASFCKSVCKDSSGPATPVDGPAEGPSGHAD